MQLKFEQGIWRYYFTNFTGQSVSDLLSKISESLSKMNYSLKTYSNE